jgi:RNA recognition motif-containing protein
LAVRLFIGNLPYGASEADLRAHFSAVAEPSHIVMPVDRETGRPRGFAFVEFAERAAAEEVIKRFDAQPFQGRSLAVSEARAREDRPPPRPGGFSPRPPPGSGFGGPRPGGSFGGGGGGGFSGPRPGGGFGGPRPGGGGGFGGPPGPGGRDRSANFGPPAPPKRLRGAKKGGAQQESKPRGPIKERNDGRIYAVDDLDESAAPIDFDDIATSAKDAETEVETDVDLDTAGEDKGDE